MSNDRLKFRAWHRGNKAFDAAMISPEDGCQGQVFKWLESGQPVEIMQWTGLYDSEGKMIWEGDVVRAFDNINKISDPSLTERDPTYNYKAVKYLGGAFVLYSAKYDFCGVLGYNSATKPETLTVVGNIYESPDLMERANA